MNKKGGMVMVVLLMLVVIVITSAGVLILVKTGLIGVNPEYEQVPLLDTEFVPVGGEGYLVVKEFQFCYYVTDDYQCLEEKEEFTPGDEVHFRFVVESSTSNGGVMIVENYRLIDPMGKVILDVDAREDFQFEVASRERIKTIAFKDYFLAGYELIPGEYALELHLENPLINKKAKLTENFRLK